MVDTTFNQPKKPFARWLLLLGLVGIVLLIVLLLLGINRIQSSTPASTTNNQVIANDVNFPQLIGSQLFYEDSAKMIRSVNLVDNASLSYVQLTLTPLDLIIAPNGTRALFYAQNTTTNTFQWFTVDFATHTSTPLHPSIIHPTWSATGDRILYSFVDQLTSQITVAKPDGEDWQSIMPLSYIYRSFWWSPKETYAIGLNLTATVPRLELIAVSSKEVTPITNGVGTAIWSPDGTRAILAIQNDVDAVNQLLLFQPDTNQSTTLQIAQPTDQFAWIDNEQIALLANLTSATLTTFNVNKNKQISQRTVNSDIASDRRLIGVKDDIAYLWANDSLWAIRLQ